MAFKDVNALASATRSIQESMNLANEAKAFVSINGQGSLLPTTEAPIDSIRTMNQVPVGPGFDRQGSLGLARPTMGPLNFGPQMVMQPPLVMQGQPPLMTMSQPPQGALAQEFARQNSLDKMFHQAQHSQQGVTSDQSWMQEFAAARMAAQKPPGIRSVSSVPQQTGHLDYNALLSQPQSFLRNPLTTYAPMQPMLSPMLQQPLMMPQTTLHTTTPLLTVQQPPQVISHQTVTQAAPTPTVVQQAPKLETTATPESVVSDTAQELSEEDIYGDSTIPVQPQGGGLGMGMDKAMLDQLRNSSDPKWRNSKFLKFLQRINDGEIEFKDDKIVEKVKTSPLDEQTGTHVDDLQAELTSQLDRAKSWERKLAEQNDLASEFAQQYDMDDPQTWQEDMFADLRQFDMNGAIQKALAQPQQAPDPEYKFIGDNAMAKKDNLFQEGIRLLKAGELKQAILAFEGEVQQHPENAEAWRFLGQAQAENEEETLAIAALLKCISLDPYNLKALMMLGVSYTNDLEEARALNYLKTWLVHNSDYQSSQLVQQQQTVSDLSEFYHSDATMDRSLHSEVMKMFLEATKINPKDADLYTTLGVLYHLTNDYDKAIEAFKNALKLKPDDPTLWNKLGATQANSSRSADAVHAYRRALQLRPNYVRALANLAISYANQGQHEDAAKAYLVTLERNPNASHVWSYLRMSLSHMGKEELVELTHKKDVSLFKKHFNF